MAWRETPSPRHSRLARAGYNIYVHAPGAWGAIATSAEAPSPRPGAYPPPPHYQAPVALVTAAGVGEPAPVPGAPVQGWGA